MDEDPGDLGFCLSFSFRKDEHRVLSSFHNHVDHFSFTHIFHFEGKCEVLVSIEEERLTSWTSPLFA